MGISDSVLDATFLGVILSGAVRALFANAEPKDPYSYNLITNKQRPTY